jgi:acyl-CoA synthetase (AMP-forming)/AMP-acid ligase II
VKPERRADGRERLDMASEALAPQTLPALLDRAVAAFGDQPAVLTLSEALTYRQLQARSAAVAKGLVAMGVGKGSRVALLAGNTPFWTVSFFALAQVGALTPAISTLAAPAELAYMLRHCDAEMILMGRRFANRDYAQIIAQALPSLASVGSPGRLRLPEAPYLRSIWMDDAQGAPWAGGLAELIRAGANDPDLTDDFLEQIKAEVAPSDDAVIIYTSGSTTAPKAVVHTHGPLARKAGPLAELQMVRHSERIAPLSPMFWVGGMNLLLEAVAVGAALVLPEGPSTRAAVDLIRELGCDRMAGWPAQTTPIREMLEAEGVDYSHIRGLRIERLADGAIKPPDLVPNSLGMTETFGPHCGSRFDELLPEHRRGAFGPVFFDFERRVVDPVTGQKVAAGEVGELYLRGGSLMNGFYKKEASESFTPDGFYGTCDLVRILPDGYMYFQGRTGDMLKTKGANVSRLEVEIALRGLPGVAEAVVCGLPDKLLGQRVVAAVVPRPGEQVSEDGLIAGLKEKIAAYKAPSRILVIERDDLIMSATGKVRIPEMGKLIAERLGLPVA